MSQSTSQALALNPSLPVNESSELQGKMSSSENSTPTFTQPLVCNSNIIQNTETDNNNLEFTNEMNRRFDAIKQNVIQKTKYSKSSFNNKPQRKESFEHISLLLNDYNIKYDKPLSVEEIAAIRAERIIKDKQAAREARREEKAKQQAKQGEIAKFKAQLLLKYISNSPNASNAEPENVDHYLS